MNDSRPIGGALQAAATALARDGLTVGVGGRLPTNQHYLTTQGIGSGTLQRALDELRARGALTTHSRGQLGRIVTQIDIKAAWASGSLPSVRLVLPPAGPVEVTTLEQVLAEALSTLGIPHTVQHLRGGSTRLEMLLTQQSDMAVFSTAVLEIADQKVAFRKLGVGTYYGKDRIAVVTRSGESATKAKVVAIDEDSPDHKALSFGEFPPEQGYQYRNVPFPHIPAAVGSRQADIGIWHIIPSVVPLELAGICLSPLATPTGQQAWQATSEAVLAIGLARPELNSVIAQLDLTDLTHRQQQAIATDSGLVPV